jgi:hypothetical protein
MANAWGSSWGSSWGSAFGSSTVVPFGQPVIAQSVARIGVNYGRQHVARLGLYGPEEQDGRSGYWRLFYTQLQEEALKAGEKASDHKEPVVAAKKPAKKVKKAKVKTSSDEAKEFLPLPPIPTYTPTAPQPNYVVDAWRIGIEIQALLAFYRPAGLQFRYELNVAANDSDDEEEELELLLLVA